MPRNGMDMYRYQSIINKSKQINNIKGMSGSTLKLAKVVLEVESFVNQSLLV